jgi:Uma2 family endonuclease
MTALHQSLSVAEYLERELHAEVRHEFVNGEMLPTSGETDIHNDIAGNIYAALKPKVRARGCRIYFGDVKVRVAGERYRYPDVFITCEPESETRIKNHPCFILEVISETTADVDRGAKLYEYQSIPSLEQYVLIEQKQQFATVYRRGSEGWLVSFCSEGAIEIPSVEASFTFAETYAGIEFSKS